MNGFYQKTIKELLQSLLLLHYSNKFYLCYNTTLLSLCFQSIRFKGLNTHCFIPFRNTEYLTDERVLTQAEVLNTKMRDLVTPEYSSEPHTTNSGQVMYYVNCNWIPE